MLTAMDEITVSSPGEEPAAEPADVLVEEELLIEEISIDGMCGVY
jgi:mycofactocin precursor